MSGDDNASLIYGLLCLVLVASSLFARRLAVGPTLRMLLAWVAIFASIFVLFSFRYEIGQVWVRVKSELSPGGVTAKDGTLRVRKADGGHFWLATKINGREVALMVDSGATVTSLSAAMANAAGVQIDESGFPVMVETANGTVAAKRGRISLLQVGPIERRDFPVLVSDAFGDTSVVGMNFLSTLKGWRVEGDELALNP